MRNISPDQQEIEEFCSLCDYGKWGFGYNEQEPAKSTSKCYNGQEQQAECVERGVCRWSDIDGKETITTPNAIIIRDVVYTPESNDGKPNIQVTEDLEFSREEFVDGDLFKMKRILEQAMDRRHPRPSISILSRLYEEQEANVQ
jgi:hypothetical protein